MSVVSMVESQLKKLGLSLNKVLVIVAVLGVVYLVTGTNVPALVVDQVGDVAETVVSAVTGGKEEKKEEKKSAASSCSGKSLAPPKKQKQAANEPGAFDGSFGGLAPL